MAVWLHDRNQVALGLGCVIVLHRSHGDCLSIATLHASCGYGQLHTDGLFHGRTGYRIQPPRQQLHVVMQSCPSTRLGVRHSSTQFIFGLPHKQGDACGSPCTAVDTGSNSVGEGVARLPAAQVWLFRPGPKANRAMASLRVPMLCLCVTGLRNLPR